MEQRQFKRVHFFQRVQVESEGKILETYCLDVSLRGILLVLPEHVTWRLEQPLKVTLGLADGENIIIMNCFLVHLDDDVVPVTRWILITSPLYVGYWKKTLKSHLMLIANSQS